MAKVLSNGQLLDEHCKYKDGTLVNSNGYVYSCTLNQTELKKNSNKFYIMQLIKTSSSYIHFIRYGRIGDVGTIIENSYSSEIIAVDAFQKQFRSKTGNKWGNKNDFVKKSGKYFLSEVSYEEELKDIPENKPSKINDICAHDIRVQEIIKLISDIQMMKNTLVQLDIDTRKMPLGKIKSSQIEKASELLNNILKYIENKDFDKCEDLSSEYYTLIPIACGRKKPPIINNFDIINKYRDTIEEIKNMIITTKILEKNTLYINPVDNVYNEMNMEMKPIDKTSYEWDVLCKYFYKTHAPTHNFKLDLVDIVSMRRNYIDDKFTTIADKIGNKQLLIHGSRLSNWVSIVKLGLLLDPSKLGVHIAGKMFGYGIYFANSFSKSAQYCGANLRGTTRIALALAEVALGSELEKKTSDYYVSKTSLEKTGHQSCWGKGNMTPSEYSDLDGMKVPTGALISSNCGSVLRYDEKIIYDSDQYRFRYLVIADMTY